MCTGVRVLSNRVVSPSRPGPTCLQQLNASQGQLSASLLLLRLASNLLILRSSFADLAVRDLPPRAGPTKESSRVLRAYLNHCAQPAGSGGPSGGCQQPEDTGPLYSGRGGCHSGWSCQIMIGDCDRAKLGLTQGD